MNTPRPTESELAILNVLWQRGPSTVRDVFEVLSQDKELGYTTVLKLMQIMNEKQLVKRDESSRTHVYEAAYSQEKTQQQLALDLLERAFAGSASRLVLQALNSKPTSKKELAEIRKLLDELEKKR
jgi:BlaI family transcriptional regulator, penicillinase repressor